MVLVHLSQEGALRAGKQDEQSSEEGAVGTFRKVSVMS